MTARPIKGKANKAVIELQAKFFKVKNKDKQIVKSKKSNKKIVEVNAD